jgi:hypothetical protein
MHEEVPNVVRLQLHLKDQQHAEFDPEAPALDQAVERAQKTQLLQYFKANEDDVGNVRELTYQEFPNYLAWDKAKRKWSYRQRKHLAIGHMSSIPPSTGELFYMRLLLTVFKGATSHDNLRTVEGALCESFKEACRKYGLLEDDREWKDCLNDARFMKTGMCIYDMCIEEPT